MKITESRLREIIKEELKDYKIPYSIGFKKREDFKHGLVQQMFKFFYMMDDQPVGNFKDMADAVHDRKYELDDMLGQIGTEAQELHDYLRPPSGKEVEIDLHQMTQDNAAEIVYKYLDQANQLAIIVKDSVTRGGAAKTSKVKQGLKGILKTLEKAKAIFTSSFGAPVKRKIGFNFGK